MRCFNSLTLLVGTLFFHGFGVAAAPINHVSTGASNETRITALERISESQSQLIQQLQQYLNDTQSEIDVLRGEVQQSTYQLQQVVERQKNLYQRLDELKSSDKAAIVGRDTLDQEKDNIGFSSGQIVSAIPRQDMATQTEENGLTTAKNGNPEVAYNQALASLLEKKQPDKAMAEFQSFIDSYPTSSYVSNAHYWLGQIDYNKGNKDAASFHFATVVKNYPKGSKAPDALYKVGNIMQEEGETDKARAVYQRLIKEYPNAAVADKAKQRLSSLG